MPELSADQQELRLRLARIARLMDSSIRVPIIGKRIGWEAIIGLVPGVGDVAGGLISAYIVLAAKQLGVSWPVVVRMMGNIGLEVVVGTVPLLGDLFDMAFRANLKNVALMEDYLERESSHQAPDDGDARS